MTEDKVIDEKILAEYALYNAILEPYLGEELEIGKLYYSPLPDHEDSTESFTVYKGVNKEGNETGIDFTTMLFWKDWGYGKHLGHRPVHLIQHLNPGMSKKDALHIIQTSNFNTANVTVKTAVKKPLTHLSSFAYTPRELNYWAKKYYVERDLLLRYKVMGTRVIYSDNEKVYDSNNGPTTFTYLGPDGKFQLYRPKPKWIRRSVGSSFLLGYEQLPYKGRILLILSGMKDGLCCYRATGWPFLSASGENDYHTFEPYIKELKERFEYIGVCQDPDPPGIGANALLAAKLDIPVFNFPYPDEEMDIADLMEKFGPEKLRKAFYLKTPFKV